MPLDGHEKRRGGGRNTAFKRSASETGMLFCHHMMNALQVLLSVVRIRSDMAESKPPIRDSDSLIAHLEGMSEVYRAAIASQSLERIDIAKCLDTMLRANGKSGDISISAEPIVVRLENAITFSILLIELFDQIGRLVARIEGEPPSLRLGIATRGMGGICVSIQSDDAETGLWREAWDSSENGLVLTNLLADVLKAEMEIAFNPSFSISLFLPHWLEEDPRAVAPLPSEA